MSSLQLSLLQFELWEVVTADQVLVTLQDNPCSSSTKRACACCATMLLQVF